MKNEPFGNPLQERFRFFVEQARESKRDFIVEVLERILEDASSRDVSDVHFHPEKDAVEVRIRWEGVLHLFGRLEAEYADQIAARLKVLAHLLTYKTDTPQEGRVRAGFFPDISREMRISTAPTLHGERVVVRFFSSRTRFQFPDELGFPSDILEGLLDALRRNTGAILITGPAGSGKTTTAYALLRELVHRGETLRSVITLEDPIEHALEGIAQIEVNDRNPLSLDEMIKYALRQDPEILLVGEIRDRKTAESSMQAALTGHLVVSTFHAGSAVEACARLNEFGVEPFVLRSGITYVLSQRLLRRLCEHCKEEGLEPVILSISGEGRELSSYFSAKGCEKCNHSGYSARILLAEALPVENGKIAPRILDGPDTQSMQAQAVCCGMIPLQERAFSLVQSGLTSPMELRRVFG